MTKHQRSYTMSRIRSSDTQQEKRLRSALHRKGFRFKKNVRELPGKPDIVLPKFKTVIFVNGCFWHQHSGCSQAVLPKSNRIERQLKRRLAGRLMREPPGVWILTFAHARYVISTPPGV